MERTNALAELAEQLVTVNNLIAIKIGYFSPVVAKAQRIVAELAKVEYYECIDGTFKSDEEEVYDAFINCRAIAEEGFEDGK